MSTGRDAARVLITGGGGQLASNLAQQLPADSTVALPRAELDITDAPAVERAFTELAPAVVINTAAYNHVDMAETEFDRAFDVNAQGSLTLARACAAANATLVHVSTDYVFGGQAAREPLSEGALPAPLSVYGVSKLAGEHLVRGTGVRHLIVRTCGLYGSRGSAVKGGNFVRTMLRLAREGRDLRVVNDQHCTPSYARDVAEGIIDLIQAGADGTFHVVNDGVCTWFEFAREIFAAAGLAPSLTPVTTAEYPTPAGRPPYSVLATDRMIAVRGRPLRDWRAAVRAYLAELGELSGADG
ncbi:MAG: dTDP-4-dehydrorhamnose reductase [Chloroflexi bacterium]|nr:dTDP-4-dehydrorhamnose reductase [Chloroflexota bacterium]